MSIVTQTMLSNRVGAAELVRLTDDAGSSAVNTDVMGRCVAEGEGELLGRIGQRYTLPLLLTDAHTLAMVTTMLVDAVVYRLFVHREQGAPEEVAKAYRAAVEWASQIASGGLGLAGESALSEAVSQAGQILVETTPRVISRETMRGL